MTQPSAGAEWYRALVETSPEAAYVVLDGNLVYLNPAATTLFGASTSDELVGTAVLDRVHPGDHALALSRRKLVLELGQPAPLVEMRFVSLDGRVFEVEVQATRIEVDGRYATIASARDISVRKRLEDHVRQSQKLEAVGRLAGGIAHDFNNTLAIIIGHTEFVLNELAPDHPFRADLEAVQRAAQHSATLTRQLLTYARRQAFAPRPLDLNVAVSETLRMIRPLIGESIVLQWLPSETLWPVALDPSQLDQILTNLCANARDAIDDVGTLTISTSNRTLDDIAAQTVADAQPGEYVVLTVTDNGRGMSAEVLARAFEPFFTTKPIGRGTGLGLATIYGIVRQNHGFVSTRSVVDVGTRFEVYFPRHGVEALPAAERAVAAALPTGSETLLVVEDEPDILQLTCRALRAHGYTVLAANGPEEALRILESHQSPIALMLTDVMMPVMSGPDLARAVPAARHGMRVMFMSGFSADLIAKHGRLDPDTDFIGKPFTLGELTTRVREVLDRRDAA